MYSGSVAATGTQSAGSAAAMACSHATSRPAVRCPGPCGRCTITHRCGLCLASVSARSRIGRYSTMRLTSMPHEAETTTFGVASSIRRASSCAANPPNTTECTAPVHGVETGIDHATGEPPVKRSGGGVEDGRWAFIPIDRARGLAPKSGWVGETAAEGVGVVAHDRAPLTLLPSPPSPVRRAHRPYGALPSLPSTVRRAPHSSCAFLLSEPAVQRLPCCCESFHLKHRVQPGSGGAHDSRGVEKLEYPLACGSVTVAVPGAEPSDDLSELTIGFCAVIGKIRRRVSAARVARP